MLKTGVKSPLKYIGGKSAALEHVLSLFPEPKRYTRYVDLCGGAAWVLLGKPEDSRHEEIYNDLDRNLFAFWWSMKTRGAEMREQLEGLLYSRELYYEWYKSLFDQTEMDRLERAVRYFYCLRATGTGWLRRSPVGWNGGTKSVSAYHSALALFSEIQSRLKNVVIDNRDVIATINRYAGPGTLFYLDPPYIGAEWYYEVCRGVGFPHEEVASLLNTVQGFVAVSGYPSAEMDALYPAEKWERHEWTQHKSSQIQLATRPEDQATEVLRTNYHVNGHHVTSRELWEV